MPFPLQTLYLELHLFGFLHFSRLKRFAKTQFFEVIFPKGFQLAKGKLPTEVCVAIFDATNTTTRTEILRCLLLCSRAVMTVEYCRVQHHAKKSAKTSLNM